VGALKKTQGSLTRPSQISSFILLFPFFFSFFFFSHLLRQLPLSLFYYLFYFYFLLPTDHFVLYYFLYSFVTHYPLSSFLLFSSLAFSSFRLLLSLSLLPLSFPKWFSPSQFLKSNAFSRSDSLSDANALFLSNI
jgi:hypothetical protein